MPLKDFFACRFNSLTLNSEDPENGQIEQNEIWISDMVQSYNTRNI